MKETEAFYNGVAEIWATMRKDNTRAMAADDELEGIACEFLSDLCEQFVRAYFELGRPPSVEEKAMLLKSFTEHGISRETALLLYDGCVTTGQHEMPKPKDLPH